MLHDKPGKANDDQCGKELIEYLIRIGVQFGMYAPGIKHRGAASIFVVSWFRHNFRDHIRPFISIFKNRLS